MNIQDTFVLHSTSDMRDLLMSVLNESCQYNLVYRSVSGRELTDVHGKKLIDFASCNYLSFDQEQEALLPSGIAAVKEYGLHTSRARLMGYHELFSVIEKEMATFLGVEDTILFPNTTLAHIGIIPALMKKDDVIFLDKSAHATMYQGSQLARDKGSLLVSFNQGDIATLKSLLEKHSKAKRKLICVDGVYSMTGDYAALNSLQALATEYNALLYIDDAHGFGFVGSAPTAEMPYGFSGNGIVNHFSKKYDNIMYVAGTAKNFAAASAMVSVTTQMKQYLMAYAKPLDYTHPSTPFALGILGAAHKLQLQEGDARRVHIYQMTKQLIEGLRQMEYEVVNSTYFPIVSVRVGDTKRLIEASKALYERGIFLTSCPYPTMPKGEEALRITVTSNNTTEQISLLLESFTAIKQILNER